MCSRGSPELLSCNIWSYELQTILMRKESRARIALGRAYRGPPYALTVFTITYTLWELLASLWRSALRRTSVRLAHCLQLLMRFGNCLHHCGGLLCGGPPFAFHIVYNYLCALGIACIIVEVFFAEHLPASSTLFAMTYALWGLLASLWRSAFRRTSVRLAHYLR